MHEIAEAFSDLLRNGAFWTFLGVLVTSYFGYKEVTKRSPTGQAKKVRNASSFEELRAVVEVLQSELVKKDKRHKDDTDYMLSQLTEARAEVRSLGTRLADALKKAAVADGRAENCADEVERLKRVLLANGITE